MKRFFSKMIPQICKNWLHLLSAVSANVYYGFPAKKLLVIGVTGTNGKTTTTQMIGSILRTAGKKVAIASTIDFWMDDEQRINTSKFTTMSPWALQRFLREAVDKKIEMVVLETSSHALDQGRVWGIPYQIVVMTNVTREHLDYHKTMERYRKAKRKLFECAPQAVINQDMVSPEYFVQALRQNAKVLLYSTKNKEAHLFAKNIMLNFNKTIFRVDEDEFILGLAGMFNIENALAAIGVADLLGIERSLTKKGLEILKGVPGRMESMETLEGVDVIIDYAVTPDAFEKLYASVLPLKIPGTKIIHIFGACGERDQGKRSILGSIASGYADVIILTNEDPYYEDGEQIINHIEEGLSRTKTHEYFRIYDRREAIHKGLSIAERGDIVLITGKGAETSMAIGSERIPWSEHQVIREELARIEDTKEEKAAQ